MMPRPLRILCVPFVPVLGQPQRNQKTLQDLAQKVTSLENPPDVVVLPELALSGYLMESVTALAALEYKEIVQMAALLDPAGSCEWILGLPLREGNAIFNAAAVCKAGKVCHLHRKIFLPTYGMFDEARYFHRGERFTTYEGTCGRTAVMICEDAWHAELAFAASALHADTVVVLSSSPARGFTDDTECSSTQRWRQRLAAYAESYGQNYIYCNRAGCEDGVLFDGTSFVLTNQANFVPAKPCGVYDGSQLYELSDPKTTHVSFGGNSSQQNDVGLIVQLLQKIQRDGGSKESM